MCKFRTAEHSRATKIKNKNWEDKALKLIYYQRTNMRIGKIASSEK